MKLILETQELEAIVRENIASKYPNQEAKVTVQNKRNGVEVTVVLTEKQEVVCEEKCYETTSEKEEEEDTLS